AHGHRRVRQRRQRHVQGDGGKKTDAPSAIDLDQLASTSHHAGRQYASGAERHVLEAVDALEADEGSRSLAAGRVALPPAGDITWNAAPLPEAAHGHGVTDVSSPTFGAEPAADHSAR